MDNFKIAPEIDSLHLSVIVKLDFFSPVSAKDLDCFKDCFDLSWLGLGEKVYEFELLWAQRFKCKHAIACNSATAALHIILLLHQFPPGSEVIVPSLTFTSSASVILYAGLTPVFVDICPISLTVDVEQINRHITPKTVANYLFIMVVNLVT